MRKELGKWLMDIAKYMTTAVLLSTVFGDMNKALIIVCVIGAVTITLGWGLYLVQDNKKSSKSKRRK